jgi:hypothetical protein
MKVLVMFVGEFSYTPAQKNLETAVDVTAGATFTNSILAFIQVEESDEPYDIKSREKKLVNHLKWTARKNNCNKIILHSFAHLSDSKASVEFTGRFLTKRKNGCRMRVRNRANTVRLFSRPEHQSARIFAGTNLGQPVMSVFCLLSNVSEKPDLFLFIKSTIFAT